MTTQPEPAFARAFRLLKAAADGFVKDDGPRLSAALAYYSALSLAPLLLIAVTLADLFLGDEAASGAVRVELRDHLGDAGAVVVEELITSARKPSENLWTALAGPTLLLIGAAGFFSQLQTALDRIWNVEPATGRSVADFLSKRLPAFGMVIFSGFLLLASMLATTAVQAFSHQLPSPAWVASGGLLSLGMTAALFSILFKVLPKAGLGWRDAWAGGLFTAVLFQIGKFALGWYLGRQAGGSLHGSAGAFVLVLSWLYYSSAIVLFGAEFTQELSKSRRKDG